LNALIAKIKLIDEHLSFLSLISLTQPFQLPS
jgi:hypothetical protein